MPRQLRGPFEKTTIQLSNALDSGFSHRSGRYSCGRSKTSFENDTKVGLWLTTVCGDIRYDPLTDGYETLTPPGILRPDITAPDGGTTRGGPMGVGVAMRSVSLMTAVCFMLRTNSSLTKWKRLPSKEASRVLRSSELGRGQATRRAPRPPACPLFQDGAIDE